MVVVFVLLLIFAEPIYPDDWLDYYLPASQDWENRTNYEVYNPPWLILMLRPLFALGWQFGFALMGAVSVGGMAWGAHVLSEDGHWVRSVLAVLNLPALFVILLGQVDGLALIGVVIAAVYLDWRIASAGMFLALIKPQIAAASVLISFWKNPYKKQVVVVAVALGIVSVLLWGLWFEDTVGINLKVTWNQAFPFWPYGLLIGLPVLAYGLFRKEEKYGMVAMPFLIPYLGPHTLIGMTVLWVAKLPLRWCWLGWLLPTLWFITNIAANQ